jgi:broad specificity phosphatase PhoE
MQISLIRHGKSRLTENEKITPLVFKKWVEKYDFNGVYEESSYPSATLEKVTSANIIVTSDLKRAVESARILNPASKIIPDPLFREVELPSRSFPLFNVKLKPSKWAIMFRLFWFSGYSKECESFAEAKLRASRASLRLIDYANEYNSVVLVGHGFFNRFIAKELQKKGWRGKGDSNKHWSCNTLSYTKL